MSKKWTVNDIPDLTGKVIIVTGGNSGIGFEAAKEFARKGAQTILACRSMDKAQTALHEIQAEIPNAPVAIMQLDLASLTSVHQFADEFKGKYDRLDVLVNNAGIMMVPYGTTEDGFERQMGTNHLGHFALTGLLMDLLLKTLHSRVVNVSSNGHTSGVMDFDNLLFAGGQDYSPMTAYGRSKLANLLFTSELQRRYEAAGSSAIAVAAHPGASLELVDLDLGSQASVKAAAATIVDRHPTLDILINNAGLMAMPERRTEDGVELQFGVNHLGHWTFTAGLLPSLVAAEGARVVTVTSTARLAGRTVDPEDVNLEDGYDPWSAYGRSKLANYHFALGLQDVFDRAGVSTQSLVAHPGLSHTDLQKRTNREGGVGGSGPFWERLAASLGMDADRGALPQLRAATDPRAKGGELYTPRFVNAGVPVRRPIVRPGRAAAIRALWEVSERETGVVIDADHVRALT